MRRKRVGVLAVQGGFSKHAAMLHRLDAEPVCVKKPQELEACEALIIPGGESTTMSRSIQYIQLRAPLLQFAKSKPVFGTCAGLILMAKTCHDPLVDCLGLLDVEVRRNAFGRQADSFSAALEVTLDKKVSSIRGVFIRAPQITAIGAGVNILAAYNGSPALVQQEMYLGASFHPELSEEIEIHRYFIRDI